MMADHDSDLIDKLLRIQDVIDELAKMQPSFKGKLRTRLKTAIDDLQTGKESLDDFRDAVLAAAR